MSGIALPGSVRIFLKKEEANKKRLLSWVASVDHKQIAILYLLTSLLFFAIGGRKVIAAPASPLSPTVSTVAQMTMRIVNGINDMPAFGGNLAPQDLKSILAFIETRTIKRSIDRNAKSGG